MSDYEGVFQRRMNAVIYFSCTGRSKAVAMSLCEKIGYEALELTPETQNNLSEREYENAVIVFPVHCQSYPKPMKDFFRNFHAKNVALVATYGSVNAGNALYEAAKLIKKNPIAAAYVPCSHSYVDDKITVKQLPQEFLDKLQSPSEVKLPKRAKSPFSGIMPNLRSRAIIRIKRNGSCNNCGECNAVCPTSSVRFGVTNGKCIRCLKCVAICTRNALKIKKSRVLERYLSNTHNENTIIYI